MASAPIASVITASSGVRILPLAIIFTSSRNSYFLSSVSKMNRALLIVNPTDSISSSGAVALPPSPLSTVIKSGIDSPFLARVAICETISST